MQYKTMPTQVMKCRSNEPQLPNDERVQFLHFQFLSSVERLDLPAAAGVVENKSSVEAGVIWRSCSCARSRGKNLSAGFVTGVVAGVFVYNNSSPLTAGVAGGISVVTGVAAAKISSLAAGTAHTFLVY